MDRLVQDPAVGVYRTPPHFPHELAGTDARDKIKRYIVAGWRDNHNANHISTDLRRSGFWFTPFQLCRWRLFSRDAAVYAAIPIYDRDEVYRLATHLANEATDVQMTEIWGTNIYSYEEVPDFDFNCLAVHYCNQAVNHLARFRSQGYTATSSLTFSTNNAAGVVNAPPKQPDRKVRMTCGGQVDGVIYCSEQCRPSTALEWYSRTSERANTPTMTEGFRTARSRFLTPSAASQATFDSSQFIPPQYGLEDANPPIARFVPTIIKEEPLDEEDHEQAWLNLRLPARDPAFFERRFSSIHSILNDESESSVGLAVPPPLEPFVSSDCLYRATLEKYGKSVSTKS